jgi:hypothetical protein
LVIIRIDKIARILGEKLAGSAVRGRVPQPPGPVEPTLSSMLSDATCSDGEAHRAAASRTPSHSSLPGNMKDDRKCFFTCSYTALRMRVDTLAEGAQKDKPFAHAFSPHCLRHTFAIQHIKVGTDVKLISSVTGRAFLLHSWSLFSN